MSKLQMNKLHSLHSIEWSGNPFSVQADTLRKAVGGLRDSNYRVLITPEYNVYDVLLLILILYHGS